MGLGGKETLWGNGTLGTKDPSLIDQQPWVSRAASPRIGRDADAVAYGKLKKK